MRGFLEILIGMPPMRRELCGHAYRGAWTLRSLCLAQTHTHANLEAQVSGRQRNTITVRSFHAPEAMP
jgi:hypothetical protein